MKKAYIALMASTLSLASISALANNVDINCPAIPVADLVKNGLVINDMGIKWQLSRGEMFDPVNFSDEELKPFLDFIQHPEAKNGYHWRLDCVYTINIGNKMANVTATAQFKAKACFNTGKQSMHCDGLGQEYVKPLY